MKWDEDFNDDTELNLGVRHPEHRDWRIIILAHNKQTGATTVWFYPKWMQAYKLEMDYNDLQSALDDWNNAFGIEEYDDSVA